MFDIVVDTNHGWLYAIRLKRGTGQFAGQFTGNEVTIIKSDVLPGRTPKTGMTMNIMQPHQRLGHPSEEITRKIAKELNWNITRGALGVCEPCQCSVAKARQKNITKMPTKEKPDKKNQVAYLDQCLIKDITTAKQLHWVWWIFVLGYAGLKFSRFYRTKNKMIEPTAAMLHWLSQDDNARTQLRMDNAGENIKLKNRMESKDWKLPSKVEFTTCNTPQANSHAETSFTTMQMHCKNEQIFQPCGLH